MSNEIDINLELLGILKKNSHELLGVLKKIEEARDKASSREEKQYFETVHSGVAKLIEDLQKVTSDLLNKTSRLGKFSVVK